MPTDASCEQIQSALLEALFAQRDVAADEVAHCAACPACSAAKRDLAALAAALSDVAELAPERAAAVRLGVARELVEAARPAPAARREHELPVGFGHELARLVAWSLVPLPLALFGFALLLRLGGALLAEVLPGVAVSALETIAVFATASWLAVVYGSLPFFAHRRALTRRREVFP